MSTRPPTYKRGREGAPTPEEMADEMESRPRHTPGPWVRMHDAYTERGEGITLGTTDHTEPVCSVSGYLRPLEANARLIAAAPALLAALRAVEWATRIGTVERVGSCPACGAPETPHKSRLSYTAGRHESTCVLRAALAQAEGRTP